MPVSNAALYSKLIGPKLPSKLDPGFSMQATGGDIDPGFSMNPPAGVGKDPGFAMQATSDLTPGINTFGPYKGGGPRIGPPAPGTQGSGGVGTGVRTGTNTGMDAAAGMKTDSAAVPNGPVDSDPYWTQAKASTDALGNFIKTPFSYDPNTDPAYASIKAVNQANTITAKRSTQDDMDARGIGNSTNNTERMYEIDKQSADATTAAIPQLEAAAYGRHQQDITNQQGYINALTGMSNMQNARDAQQTANTGRFWPTGAKPLVDAIMADKKAWASASPEEQKKLAADAETKRNMLGQYGIDPRLFGSDVGIDQALENEGYGAGFKTSASQAALANSLIGLGDKYPSMPNGIGQALAGLGGDYAKLGSLVDSLRGVPNQAAIIATAKNQIDQQNANARTLSANKAGQANTTAAERLKFDQDNQAEKERISITTQAEIATALSAKTREEAYQYISDHLDDLAKRGVNIVEMATAINTYKKWGSNAPASTFNEQFLNTN